MNIIHIIGIGGVGMSAIAEILHHLNYKVQGSDAHASSNTDRISTIGIKVYIGHSINNIQEAQTIIYSSAIKSDNIELIEAKKSNKVIIHRSEVLANLTKNKYTIAVSGSSGKTTTTAMIASIFDYSSIDASVIVGGTLNSYKRNGKFGNSNIFLLEADESDGTMLKIKANIAVITSVHNDHIDYYGTFENIRHAFKQFADKADYAIFPELTGIKYNLHKTVTFGFNDVNVRAFNIRQNSNDLKFDVSISANKKEYYINNLLLSNSVGIHKVNNALAAISVATKLEISEKNIRKGLSNFLGVKRRFTTIGNINGIKFIEDYAHHPNEIRATLRAARSVSQGRIIGVIELLRFARIQSFFNDFIEVLMMFDYVILTSVHPPGDKLIFGCELKDIKDSLKNCGFNYVSIFNDSILISHFINDFTSSLDIVLFIGAGNNITKLAQETVSLILDKNNEKNN
ncbi:MAG: UDP-N-acetylmuramate--L-alanine ligase [Wolbachia endosymbiont of Fragariocoptes setiger]|nr:UDP-N-acetylmuramate--L-alanine ligase [Wolbachia endosymbiont of Fragariocoptes setiger]